MSTRNVCCLAAGLLSPRRRTSARTRLLAITLLFGAAAGLPALLGPARPAGAQVPVTPAPVVPATPTTVLTATPAPTETPAAKPEVPRTPAPTATPAAPPPATPTRPPPAVPTPTPASAPRAGGIPPDLTLGLLGGGAAALAGGLALLRRGRRAG